ncbi:CPBP family intramembrane glutamic endopeptidase [Salipiger sp. PrR002]|uniref:CPBP family intramembrane glutamic endopeptidase n=1 Tax=Salipiger sp. PrR002 TaxID=2706489 RepID=UPI0013BC43EB|nr:CPBP family intramembrane glutamic endopeptidase [Salipiger sp. PrR002]NDV98339.1 CPBP family intramembrane metalloprotease [Salipiger sp. PrR002]NDW55051.1 CPBP family intramembrane metalloprotease [Salipiger sp. PrR004]
MSYRPFVMLTATARRPELWRLALGLCVAIAVSFVLGQMLFAIVTLFLPPGSDSALADAIRRADAPAGMLLLLASMVTMGVGAIAAARALHGRSAITLIGPPPVALHQFIRVGLAAGAAALVAAAVTIWAQSTPLTPGLAPLRWLALLPLTLPAILLQTASEELFFRGYLQTQLAARLPQPWVWLSLPSALFALGHYAPGTYGSAAIYVALWAFLFGLAAADLTARSGTLGPAMALHFANNLVALALVAPEGQMSGLALMRWPFALDDATMLMRMLPLDLITLLITWLAARLALRR